MRKLIIICVLSIIAFINAVYLTYENYKIETINSNAPLGTSICDINNSFSCTNVLSSGYSKVFGLPFPAIAMFVYPIIFLIAYLGINGVIKKPYNILALMGIGGIIFNGYFILQEFLHIGSYCPLCMICSAIITTIFILSVIGIYKKEDKPKTFFQKLKSKFNL